MRQRKLHFSFWFSLLALIWIYSEFLTVTFSKLLKIGDDWPKEGENPFVDLRQSYENTIGGKITYEKASTKEVNFEALEGKVNMATKNLIRIERTQNRGGQSPSSSPDNRGQTERETFDEERTSLGGALQRSTSSPEKKEF